MKKDTIFKIVKELPFDAKKTVCMDDDVEVFIFRPAVLPKRFKSYDVNKNFQIWLKEKEREFRPNHLRVMIDLKEKLLTAFDNIFYGEDPIKELKVLSEESFDYFLNPLITIGVLHQLFIIEQEYCYNKESKFDPPTLFYQGWIREFLDNPKEIDNLCMSVCAGQPPLAKYVNLENKKSKKVSKDLKPLWYLSA